MSTPMQNFAKNYDPYLSKCIYRAANLLEYTNGLDLLFLMLNISSEQHGRLFVDF